MREVQRAPVVGRDAIEHELVPGRDLMEPRERDPGVREQVHCVPGLVAKPAPDDHDRGHDDGDEQSGSDRRGDHARVDAATEHRRDFVRQGDLVHEGIAPDRQHDVREDQVEAGVAVPAVPHGQAVEAEQPLHRGSRASSSTCSSAE